MAGDGFDDTQLGKLAIPVEFDVSKSGEKLKTDAKRAGQQAGRITAEEIRKAEMEWDRRYSGKSAEEMAKNTVRELKNQYRSRVGEARAALIEGVIDRKEFAKQARLAARDTNAAILREMQAVGKGNAGFGVLASGLVDVEKNAKRGAAGVGEMRESFASLLARLAGVHPVLGRITNVMGGLALGSVFMGAVLAGLSALAFGWQKVTEKAREAKKAHDEDIESLKELQRQQNLGPAGELGRQAGTGSVDMARLRKEMADRERFFKTGQAPEGAGQFWFPRAKEEIQKDIDELQSTLDTAWGKLGADQDERDKGMRDREASNLASLVTANKATADEIARAREIIRAEYAKLADADTEGRAQALQRIRQLEGAFEAAAKPGEEARKKQEDEAKRASERLAGLEDDLQKRLATLTATASDDLLVAIDRLERDAREAAAKAGEEVSQSFLGGLSQLRDDARATQALEGWQNNLAGILRLDGGTMQKRALSGFIARMKQEAEGLDESSRARKEYIDLIHRAEEALDRLNKATAKQTETEQKRTADEERRAREEELRDLRDRARLIEENARAGVQLANALGLVGDEAARSLESLAQLGGAIFRIAGGDLSAIPSAIGATAQLLKGLFGGNSEAAAEARRLHDEEIEAMNRLVRALDEARNRVAGDLTESERTDLRTFLNGLMNREFIQGAKVDSSERGTLERITRLLGVDIATVLDSDDRIKSFDAIRQLLKALADLDVGVFSKDLVGSLDALDFLTAQLGDHAGTAAEQLARFLEVLASAEEGKAGGFAAAFKKVFDEQGATAAEAFIEELLRRFAANDQSLFGDGGIFAGLTAEEVKRLLEDSNNLLDQIAGGGGGGTTRDAIQLRSITDVRASRMEGALYGIEALLAQGNNQRDEMLQAILRGAGLSSAVVSPAFAASPELVAGSPTFNFGDINIDVGGGDSGVITAAQAQMAIKEGIKEHLGATNVKPLSRALAGERRSKLRAAGRTS